MGFGPAIRSFLQAGECYVEQSCETGDTGIAFIRVRWRLNGVVSEVRQGFSYSKEMKMYLANSCGWSVLDQDGFPGGLRVTNPPKTVCRIDF